MLTIIRALIVARLEDRREVMPLSKNSATELCYGDTNFTVFKIKRNTTAYNVSSLSISCFFYPYAEGYDLNYTDVKEL